MKNRVTDYGLSAIIFLFLLSYAFGHNCTCESGDDGNSDDTSISTTTLIFNFVAIIILVCFSGLFSGLTLGLLGLDLIGLEIVIDGDNEELKACAKKIYPVRQDGNLLLCTLLLGNVAVNALLSILLADLTSGLVGFIASTALIVIFGEIVPQASCSRYALQIGSKAIPIVKVIMIFLYIFAKPISMVLDFWLGEEVGTIHSRYELMKLLQIHVSHGAVDDEAGAAMAGALRYKDMTVEDVITPMEDVFMLQADETLNFKTISEIFKTGFSRIPIFDKDKNDVTGILLTKDLIFIDPEDEVPIRHFLQIFGRSFLAVWPDQLLGEVRKEFKKNFAHLGIVRDVNNEGEVFTFLYFYTSIYPLFFSMTIQSNIHACHMISFSYFIWEIYENDLKVLVTPPTHIYFIYSLIKQTK